MDIILWFKRDLRIADNPAMTHAAAQGGRILPLYIAEPDLWAQPDAAARHWAFIAESLAELRDALGTIGAPLIIRTGDAVDILSDLSTRHGIRILISHEETGNAWTYARDRRVAAWARANGVTWTQIPQMDVIRRLDTRDGWARRREQVLRQPILPAPAALNPVPEDPGAIPTATELGLAPDACLDRQTGGRNMALSLLGGFLTERGRDYRRAMSTPLEGASACSRLSPHLAWGTLSMREAQHAATARKAEVAGTRDGWIGSLKSFEARLAWRGHFMQKLEDAPSIETRCLHTAYEGLRPVTPDAARLAAWEKGETGIPFVDACMRSLIATGWLNFRMRAMLVSVASYQLWLDWRVTGPHLARVFTDYEPGIHWPQVQMQSGTTGMNTVRIYNPVKQGHDQDPTGAFTRTWCPELTDVPDAHLQTPWTWEGAGQLLGKAYPEPIVDLTAAAKSARERVWAVRRGDAFRNEAQAIVQKHASRKDGSAGRHFVNDRAKPKPRRKKPPNTQLSLDL